MEETPIRLYKGIIIPILRYNANSIVATQTDLEKLDKCQRKLLPPIIALKWPIKLIKEELYSRCSVEPITQIILKSRWNMLGNVLRQPTTSITNQALLFALFGSKNLKVRKGKHQTNLYQALKNDIFRIFLCNVANGVSNKKSGTIIVQASVLLSQYFLLCWHGCKWLDHHNIFRLMGS